MGKDAGVSGVSQEAIQYLADHMSETGLHRMLRWYTDRCEDGSPELIRYWLAGARMCRAAIEIKRKRRMAS